MNNSTEIDTPACACNMPSLTQLASAFSGYCRENNILASVDISDITYEPAGEGTFIVKSTVKITTDCLSSCKASFMGFVKQGDDDAISGIIYNSLAMALSLIGFESFYSPSKEVINLDKNLQQTGTSVLENDSSASVLEGKATDKAVIDSASLPESDTPVKYIPMNPELSGPMTLKDAYCFKIPLGSPQQGKGRTISEVMGMNPGLISWYASDAFNPDRGSKEAIKERRLLKQACAMVTEAAAE